jgi:NitT/TauT family transport system permease protein
VTRRQLACLAEALGVVAAMLLPLGDAEAPRLMTSPALLFTALAALALALSGFLPAPRAIAFDAFAAGAACIVAIVLLRDPGIAGHAGPGFWTVVLTAWIAATQTVAGLSRLKPRSHMMQRLLGMAVPLLFGSFLFFLWEVLVRGFGVPAVLMPAPSAIAERFGTSLPTLAEDFVQTFLRGVLAGYAIGSVAGFLIAIVADRIAFLQRGLLPLGHFVAALPIVGIAPIMVMWFGFDWQSKAAVVAVMTFFPMLVNTVAGLAAPGRIERDLMRSYGASYWQSLLKLRLPAAMPFIFNALKINSTLALIGAIVAEFFGTPIVGMGFRISIEVARMSLDMVWAEIALAAISGTIFYGVVALAERAITFWHPSYRT